MFHVKRDPPGTMRQVGTGDDAEMAPESNPMIAPRVTEVIVDLRANALRFALDRRSFSYWNSRTDRWKVVPGCARVLVGTSSRKIKLKAPISVRGGCRPG